MSQPISVSVQMDAASFHDFAAFDLLRHLGFDEAAAKIDAAVEADIEELGSTTRSTDEVGKDILARM